MGLDSANLITGGKLFDGQDISATVTSTKKLDISGQNWVVGLQGHSDSAARGGTLSFEESIDDTNWNTVEFVSGGVTVTSFTITAAQAFDCQVNLTNLGGNYLRAKFTDSASGAGTLTLWAQRKFPGR